MHHFQGKTKYIASWWNGLLLMTRATELLLLAGQSDLILFFNFSEHADFSTAIWRVPVSFSSNQKLIQLSSFQSHNELFIIKYYHRIISNQYGFGVGDARVILNDTKVIHFGFQASRHQRGFGPFYLFPWRTNPGGGGSVAGITESNIKGHRS